MEDERIPTMPQGMNDERIPTMPQGMNEERIPTMPQGMNEERIPTMPQGMSEERIPTIPQSNPDENGRIATMPQQGAAAGNVVGGRYILTHDMSFIGEKGGEFVIEASNIVSADSGESQIYGCHGSVGSDKYVARVLTSVTPESGTEKILMRNKVIRFLDSVSNNPDSHILPLVDHAKVNILGKEYYVEVYPYCEGGDLGTRKGKISYSEMIEEIVPAINQALKHIHSAGLVHRDIKPENFYKYNGRVVLGDFGITCDLRGDGFATDRYKTGTLGYYAPELMSQAAIKASDYYSFGQTIWTLYSGEMMYRNILRMYKDQGLDEQRNQINFAMLNSQYYGLEEIGKSDAFFEVLIRGLLQYDPKERFDYQKVNRWLLGDKSLAKEIINYKDDNTFTREFKICGQVCWDSSDVCKVLADNWETGKEMLYSGELKDFYASQNYEIARFFDGIMKQYSICENEEDIDYMNNIGLSKVILHLSKNKILCWMGEQYTTLEDISLAVGKYIEKLIDGKDLGTVDYCLLIYSGLVVEWYQNKKNAEESVVSTLIDMREMLCMNQMGRITMLIWLSMCFLKERMQVQFENCHNEEELLTYMTETPASMYVMAANECITLVECANFLGFLCALGYSDVVKTFIEDNDMSILQKYEMLYDFMENVTTEDNKDKIRAHYHNYGPRSYYFWWKKNLALYDFVGPKSQALKMQIESIALDEKQSIEEQRGSLQELEQLYINFKELDISDIFMIEMGLCVTKEKSFIKANHMTGVWNYQFLGNEAPIGYKYVMHM